MFTPGMPPLPDAEPVPLSTAKGIGFVAGGAGSLCGDGVFCARDCPLTFARDSRFGALSDAGPQPSNPAKSTALRSNAMRGYNRCRDGRDERMSSVLNQMTRMVGA